MTASRIVFDEQAREALRRGVNQLARVVGGTFGPAGHAVLIERPGSAPLVTRDGATVAREIELPDRLEDAGARLVRDAASRTADEVGDGTTTATLYAQAIFEEGIKHITVGANARALRAGIAKAVECVTAELRRMSDAIAGPRQLAQVGGVAANGDTDIGEFAARAVKRVGAEGLVIIESAHDCETHLETVQGVRFNHGYISRHFVTDPRQMAAVLDNAYLLVCDGCITAAADLLPILESVARASRPLLIVAEDLDGEALKALIVNKMQRRLFSAAVRVSGAADARRALLQDIAVLTGTEVVAGEFSAELRRMELKQLGAGRQIRIERDTTTIVDGRGSPPRIAEHAGLLRREIETSSSEAQRGAAKARLARFTGAVAVLRIGAPTEIELQERRARAEDAVCACRAALEAGVLVGGAVSPVYAGRTLEALRRTVGGDERAGVDIVRRALAAPLQRIADNAGIPGTVVVQKVQSSENPRFGFNAQTKQYGDLMAMGVIVPSKVECAALRNAAAVASQLLTTDAAICEAASERSMKEDTSYAGT